ncbi:MULTISPECIES: serine hydrolase domain-containing protein [Streptomyces]|uniref:Peptidase n=2 Tax=Streptomyces TaxID=1883 RepID=A0A2U9P0T1_STRAS|nr:MULTISPECIES: serine hydrolase domain-containing protein [Streptomyces]AWT43269.1 peptidase [Streptomyces actuosus]MBM4824571.1 beta-lactamase family protein [Streptomyces actuosus]GHF69011.1 D-alanyl-D-alanine carboxypeptidase [Streptomyces griseosporeus]
MAVRKALAGAAALVASVALAAPALAAGPAHHDATRAALRAAVADGVPGVTATVTEGRTGWSATEGVGDLRRGTPRSTADRYRVGSVSKTFVATVLLQLEAEGRLSLDDTVEKWLPGVVRGHGHDGRRVTVRQLLNHTSGIYDYTRDDGFVRTYFLKDGFLQHRYDTLRPQELVAIAMSHEPIFEPGESWTYSNTNYILAGMIVERVTGHSYGDEIRRRVIAPLGLRGTSVPGTRPTLPQPSSRAYGKLAKTATGPTYDVTELNPSLAGAAGEMISDSADLNRFYRALLGGRLLPPRQLAEMKDTVDTAGHLPGVRYGLGLADRELGCGVHVWGHNGGIHGSGTDAVTTEDGRHALAFNFNADWTGDNDAVLEAEFCD